MPRHISTRIGRPVIGVIVMSDILSARESPLSSFLTQDETTLSAHEYLSVAIDTAMDLPSRSEYTRRMRPAERRVSSSARGSNSGECSRILMATPLFENGMPSGRASVIPAMAASIPSSKRMSDLGSLAFPAHTASASSSTPSEVFEDTGMTGTPRASSSFALSMDSLLRASSILLSATMVGRPSSRASSQSTRLPESPVASATRMMQSNPCSLRFLMTTLSSSEFPDMPKVPGRSRTLTVEPFLVMAPSSNVTVVPG